jgi:hypothetical protein
MSESKIEESKDEGKNGDSKESKQKSWEPEELIAKVQDYFFGNDDLAKLFEKFVKDRAHVIDLDNEEYKLEYTTIYEEYKELFERELEGYMERQLGVTAEDFYQALYTLQDNENSSGAMFGQILGAIAGFECFMQMMKEAAAEGRREAAGKGDPDSEEDENNAAIAIAPTAEAK